MLRTFVYFYNVQNNNMLLRMIQKIFECIFHINRCYFMSQVSQSEINNINIFMKHKRIALFKHKPV